LQHNEKLWERYRNGYIRQEELRVRRMWLSLLDFKIADDELAQEMSIRFPGHAADKNYPVPLYKGNTGILTGKGYILHLITNGFEKTQHNKLMYSGVDIFF
jgi:putative hydrolase of the HAD superfamily